MSILEAADGEPARTVVDVHAGIATKEALGPRIATGNCTRPIAADGANIAERTTAVEAVARDRQPQRGVISPGRVITAPALALSVPLGFGWKAVAYWAWVVNPVHSLP